MSKLIASGLFALVALPAAAQHAAHEHGVAALEVAVDGPIVVVELHGPADNFVGFEHAPRSKAERAAVDRALALLRDPARVVALPAAAACRPTAVGVPDPFIGAEGRHADDPDHGHGARGDEGAPGHADLAASYRFECARPEAVTGMEVRLFEAFPRLARLRAVSVSARGQNAVDLRRGGAVLPL